MTRALVIGSHLFASVAFLMAGCGQLPRDPRHTLDRIRQTRHLRVGVVENPPWVIHKPGGADGRAVHDDSGEGVEQRLVREVSARLGATPQWYWGGEQAHLEALEHFELDLVIGGLDASTPWSKKIGVTRPYYTERVLIGIPAGLQPPRSLAGLNVRVLAGDQVAACVSKKGATPIEVENLRGVSGPAAAPEWRLLQLGFTPVGPDIMNKKHVMATPPGENAWLKQLQEFLSTKNGQVKSLLQRTVVD